MHAHASALSSPMLAVAPMMAWTDRHCRYLHRLYAPHARLFTEMVTSAALEHGPRARLLEFNPREHPVVLQLGGSEPEALARCAAMAEAEGYDEVNLNVGCPSDRVQHGAFGACLMKTPDLVARAVSVMRRAVHIPVTVKCRLGVDDHDSQAFLERFVDTVRDAGCDRFYIHARIAILKGLSPAQNRSVPPLHPERVAAIKARHPDLEVVINGGIDTLEQVKTHLEWADGVMIGRAAYHNPALLSECEQALFDPAFRQSPQTILRAYREYAAAELDRGTPLNALTRHLLHACNGLPGARRYRRLLSDSARLKRADLNLLDEAMSMVRFAA